MLESLRLVAGGLFTHSPKPLTLNPKPLTLNPELALNPKPP